MTADPTCPTCGTEMYAGSLDGLCPKCLGNVAFGGGPEGIDDGGDTSVVATRLGDYELLEEIARGGMGVVYRARQTSLNRIVALKLILHGPLSSPEFVHRFQTEAEAVAGLRHPNIVSIYEVGEQDGHRFLSMEYIEGPNLAELVKAHPLPARRAADYLQAMALAIQHAHEKGVLHRDLKPSNILLDLFDQPRITDFGLAKLLNRDTELTATGQVLGSPGYIPPEQAGGKFGDVTRQADLYSLGAILFHLLTGRPPFQAETLEAILVQVLNDAPVPPRRLNPSVPVDLQTICLKCLQKEPSKRYQSAGELADDLRRFLSNEPIRARPVSRLERIGLWCRRYPVTSALTAVLAIAVTVGTAGIVREWQRARASALGESRARRLAEDLAAETRLNLYAADMNLAWRAILKDDWGLARSTLSSWTPGPARPDLRGFEWRYLSNLSRGDQQATLNGHQWIVTCTAFSPDGKWVASGSQDGTVRVWDTSTHEPVATLRVATGAVWSIGFSPEEMLLMTADSDGRVKFWRPGSWDLARSIPGDFAALAQTKPVAVISESNPLYWEQLGRVSLWNYRTGEQIRNYSRAGRCVAITVDGSRLAVSGADTGIEIWDSDTGKVLRVLPTDHPVYSLAFSPDGNRLLSAGWSHDALLWDLASGQEPRKLAGHTLTVWSAVFSHNGSRIATASSDQSIRVWDGDTLQVKCLLHGHESEVWCAAFSPDDKLIATGSKDRTVRLWPAEAPVAAKRLPCWSGCPAIISPDGLRLITIGSERTNAYLWSASDRSMLLELASPQSIGFSQDGKRIVFWDSTAPILEEMIPADQSTHSIVLSGANGSALPYETCGFSKSYDVFYAVDQAGVARFWQSATGKLLRSVKGPAPPLRACALGPKASFFAVSVERDNLVRLYQIPSGRETVLAGHHDFVSGMAFSPDGTTLATGSVDGTIGLWEVFSGRQIGTLPGHMEEVTGVAFSPDGATLASINRGESIKLWHLPTHRELITIDLPHAGAYIQFTPDGRHLIVNTEDDSVRVLDAPSFGELAALEK